MPIWGTILLSLAGGLVSGSLGTWWQVRNDRIEKFRDRLLDVIDDVITATDAAISTLGELVDDWYSDPQAPWGKKDQVLFDRHNAIGRHRARVELLFGPKSLAYKDLENIMTVLRDAIATFGKDATGEQSRQKQSELTHYLALFQRGALNQMWNSGPPRESFLSRVRRRIALARR